LIYANSVAYKKEDCDTDPGWCFTASVGKSLPKTFFSYRKPTTTEEASSLAADARNLFIPTSADVLDLVQKLTASILSRRASWYGIYRAWMPHRFGAIHRRRDNIIEPNGPSTDSLKNSTAKGYTDGFTTAKIFASYNTSRLGFVGQFIEDAIRVAGHALIAEGTEAGYSAGFLRGLKHGEDAVEGKR